MSWRDSLITHVGGAVAKFLLKGWLGSAADIAGSLVDLAKEKYKDAATQREAQRRFDELGDKVAGKLVPLFEDEIRRGQVIVDNVIPELEITLLGKVLADFFLKRDLDPARLTDELLARKRKLAPLSQAEWQFHDRALTEVVRYIVGVANTLPRFQETLAAESLARLSHIRADVAKVLETARLIEEHVIGGTNEKAARYEADYRHAVTQNLDYLELFGADLPPEARRHSLSVAYVSLNLQRQGSTGEDGLNLPVESVLDGLRPQEGRLLIRGDAGGGKSTLFRWTAIRAAQMQDDENSVRERFLASYGLTENTFTAGDEVVLEISKQANWRRRVPFLIRLRDCTAGQLPSPEVFPELVAKSQGHPPTGWVRDVLTEGRGLVLLDGVDEVANLDRDKLYGEIEAIVKAYPDCYFLVSTRPEAVEGGWLKRLEFREGAINPMSAVDREQFVDKWHEAVRDELKRLDQPVNDLSLEAESLKKKLKKHATLARLATNPLMAAMICALHRRSKEHLPPSEAELVERLCFMLLHQRDYESGLPLEAYVASFRKLDYKQKKAVVQELAYHMLVNRHQSMLDREDAQQRVAYRLGLLQQSPDDAADVLRALIERSGMLRERTPQRIVPSPPEREGARAELTSGANGNAATIDFLHNTFKEYLAGTRLAHEGADGLLAEHWDKPDWVPAILFAAAAEQPKFATDLIQKLLPDEPSGDGAKVAKKLKGKRAEKVPAETRRRQLLALRCRAVGWEVDPVLAKRLEETEQALFPPRTMAEADALGEAGEAILPFLDRLAFNSQRNGDQCAACIRTLRLIGLPASEPLLLGYVRDEREGVINELAQAINPLEILAVQRMVQNYAISEKQKGIRSQIVDLSPLAGLSGLTALNLGHTAVSDVSPLAGLSGLTTLDLSGTSVSGVSPLAGLSGLTTLYLTSTSVSDVSPLAGLTRLTMLDLRGTKVSDLSPLAGLKNLRQVAVSNNQRVMIPPSLEKITTRHP